LGGAVVEVVGGAVVGGTGLAVDGTRRRVRITPGEVWRATVDGGVTVDVTVVGLGTALNSAMPARGPAL
jgi:hypothetical protein